MDFFNATQNTIRDLNKTELKLFDYVVKNMDKVKNMSIQKFAAQNFLSTTSIFRFTQKLGFSGYTDFINSLLITSHNNKDTSIPNALLKQGYRDAYLKNAAETIRVMSETEIAKVMTRLAMRPNVYILTDYNTQPAIPYAEKLFIGLGLHAYGPDADYQMHNLANGITCNDMIIALSYSGSDRTMLGLIERVFLNGRPFLMSITRADNNPLESLSDANFYIFADEIELNGMNMTSSVPMLMLLELLVCMSINTKNLCSKLTDEESMDEK